MKRNLLAALLILLAAASALAGQAGRVTHLSGALSVQKPDGATRVLGIGSDVHEGDLVVTESNAYARIRFIDGGEVVLRPNTRLKVESYRYVKDQPKEDNIFFSLLKGGLRAVTGLIGQRNKEQIAYQTPTATIGIRGTHFGALLCQGDCASFPTVTGEMPADGLHVDVAAGTISLSNSAGRFDFTAGQFAHVSSPDQVPQLVPPERGIRVTMPGSLAANRGAGHGIGKGSANQCEVE